MSDEDYDKKIRKGDKLAKAGLITAGAGYGLKAGSLGAGYVMGKRSLSNLGKNVQEVIENAKNLEELRKAAKQGLNKAGKRVIGVSGGVIAGKVAVPVGVAMTAAGVHKSRKNRKKKENK